MAAAPPLSQPFAPAPQAPLGTGPGLAPEAFATGREKLSQTAGKIQTIDQLNAAIRSQPGSNQLSEQQYKDLVKTWQDTRTTHSQPTQVAPAPPNGAVPPAGAPAPPPAAPPQVVAQHPQSAQVPSDYNPANIPALQLPQAPAPYTPPDFHPAQYQPPKKGLEYAAMALALLFPGAPIARAAAGFAQGLQQGAQQKYQRAEKTAEQQYQAERDKAQAAHENAIEAYNIGAQKAQAAYQQQAAQHAQWLQDRAEGKFFKVPPELTRILPPGTKRAPNASDYVNHFSSLAHAALAQGATQLAQEYNTEASAWQRQAQQQAHDTFELQRSWLTFQHQERLAQIHEQHTDARTAALIWSREGPRDEARLQTLRGESDRAGRSFFKDWNTALRPGTGTQKWAAKDPRTGALTLVPSGTPNAIPVMMDKEGHLAPLGQPLPSAIGQGQAGVLQQMFKQIMRAPDPKTLSDWFGNSQQNATVRELLDSFGTYADLQRRSRGGNVVEMPDSWYERRFPTKKTTTSVDDPLKAAGLNPTDPRVMAEVRKLTAAHIDPTSPEAIAAMKKDLGEETPGPAPSPLSGIGATSREAIGL